MAPVAQLEEAPVCESGCRRFEPGRAPWDCWGVAQLAARRSLKSQVVGSIPTFPINFCACSSAGSSARSITVRSQVRILPGALKLWGVGVVGQHARLSIERWSVRIRYALSKVFRDCGPAEWPQRCQR